jgi:hypothetical protein
MRAPEGFWSRRRLLLAGAATGFTAGCATGGGAARRSAGLEGREIYSESVQLSAASPDGTTVFSIRLCTYPEIRTAWVWASLLTPEGSFLFADNEVAWNGAAADAANQPEAAYSAQAGGMNISFVRTGPHGAIESGQLVFEKRGDDGFTVTAGFVPTGGFTGLLAGRSEMFGHVTATISAGGRSLTLTGPGQWHEQPQSAPRFTIPFVYGSLWGQSVSGTLLQSPEGSGAYALRPGRPPLIFREAVFGPPGPGRLVDLTAEDGSRESLTLELLHLYTLPIYGRSWTGTFVRGALLGEPVIGFVNNWMMQ